MIATFIIHNNTILQVNVIIFGFVFQIEKLLVLIDLRYSNGRIHFLRILYINLMKDR